MATGKHQETRHRKRKKKAGKVRRGITAALIVLAVLLLAAVISGYALFRHYYDMLDRGDTVVPDDGDDTYWEEPEDPEAPAQPGGDEPADDPDAESTLPPSTEDEVKTIEDELRENLEQQEANSDLYATDAFNIMLLGVDSRQDSFSGRSDSMILLSINKSAKKIVMTSFLRDIYCSIPGKGSNRLNTAYAQGGMDLHKQTIKANFGITVDRCVVVNFYLVRDAVDAVGGIDVDLTANEITYVNMYVKLQNELFGNDINADLLPTGEDGTFHLNGNQALSYARLRRVGTDFARTGRQRTVILKCLEKIKGMSLSELDDLAEEFLPKVRTDLSQGDCASLLMLLLDISDYEIESLVIPADGTWSYANIRSMDVITLNFKKNAQIWFDAVEGTATDGE